MTRRFFIALQFLTRLPVPRSLNSSETDIGKAAAFFPLVGVIVGGGASLVFVVLQRVLPPTRFRILRNCLRGVHH